MRHFSLFALLPLISLLLIRVPATAQPQSESQAAVMIDGRTLWVIKSNHRGFGPQDRANDIEESILHLARDTRRDLDDVREVNLGTETILMVARIHVFSVNDEDARHEGVTRPELLAQRRATVLETIRRYRTEHSLGIFIRSSLAATAAVFGAVIVLTLLRLGYRRASHWGAVQVPGRLRAKSRLAPFLRVFEGPIALAVRLGTRLAFAAAATVTVLATVSFSLAQFPQTASVAHVASESLFEVLRGIVAGALAYLPNLLVVAVVAAHVYALIRIAYALACAIDRGDVHISGFHSEWAMPTYALLKVLLLVFGLVVAFPYLPGGDSPALRGVSIFLGVLVSLGSGSAMGNVIAGVIIIYMRPFHSGDRVRIAGTTGDVVERSLLVTRIRTIKNVEVIIPNSQVLGGHIENFSAQAGIGPGLVLNTTVTIGYDAPWQTVHTLLIQAAIRTVCIQPEPRPFVLQTSLNDFHVSYEINAYTREPNRMAEIYSELHRNIQDEFNGASVEIMSPTYLAVRDGNTVTTPESHRPQGYVPPWFRVFTGK